MKKYPDNMNSYNDDGQIWDPELMMYKPKSKFFETPPSFDDAIYPPKTDVEMFDLAHDDTIHPEARNTVQESTTIEEFAPTVGVTIGSVLPNDWKFDEPKYLAELENYLKSTYEQHYVGKEGGTQAIDLIFDSGHGVGFCLGSINKYVARYGKKNGYDRKDLLKIAHYALLLMYLHSRDHG